MNTDFRLSVGIFTHAKFVKLQRRLGDAGALALVRLLGYVAINRPDGSLSGMDEDDVAIAAGYPGDPSALVSALRQIGWLDGGDGEALRVHDWAEHNPWAAGAPDRSESASRAANARWEKERQEKQSRGQAAQSAPQQPALPPNADSNAEVCAPQCAPHQSAVRETKTRNAPFLSSPILSDSSPSPALPGQATTTPPTSPPSAGPPGDDGCQEEVVALLLAQGISEVSARELVLKRPCDAIRQYVADLPARIEDRRQKNRSTDDPAGLLFKAIQEGWGRPESVKRRVAEEETRRQGEEARRLRDQRRQEAQSAQSVDQAKIQEAWEGLAPSQQARLEQAARDVLCKESFWREKAAKAPDDWWEKPGARERLLTIRNAQLAERAGLLGPEGAAT